MKRFKEWLIHKLGGYTYFELLCDNNKGKYNAFEEVKIIADQNFGVDWSNTVYNYVKNEIERLSWKPK